ncbi:hypothetical protein SSX86_030292 [Deinandra increscens subsp. villosa]|uniref:DUF4283 domain-containing protein n=1 Tax=Deinandra increscens subsp. villosa TaxID=3103831 RepID=A0AAP0CC51_9ASTR
MINGSQSEKDAALYSVMEDDGEGSDSLEKIDYSFGREDNLLVTSFILSLEETRLQAWRIRENKKAFCQLNTVASIPSNATGAISKKSRSSGALVSSKSTSPVNAVHDSLSSSSGANKAVIYNSTSVESNLDSGYVSVPCKRASGKMPYPDLENDAFSCSNSDDRPAEGPTAEDIPAVSNSPVKVGMTAFGGDGPANSLDSSDLHLLHLMDNNVDANLNLQGLNNSVGPVDFNSVEPNGSKTVAPNGSHLAAKQTQSNGLHLGNKEGTDGLDVGLAKDSNLFTSGPTQMHTVVDNALISIGLAHSSDQKVVENQEVSTQGGNILQIGNVSVPLNGSPESSFVYEHDKFVTLDHHDIEYEKLMGTRIWNAELFKKLIQGLDMEDSETRLLYDPPKLIKTGLKLLNSIAIFMAKCNKAYALHLFGHLVGKTLPFFKVKQCAIRMWYRFGLSEVYRNNAGVYLFKFSDENGMQSVLQQGAWLFDDVPMVLELWQPDSCLDKPDPSMVPIWVLIMDLPLSLWNGGNISQIVSGIGRPIMLDKPTYERCKTKEGVVGYARVLVHALAQNGLPDSVTAQFPTTRNGEGKVCSFSLVYNWKPPFVLNVLCQDDVDDAWDDDTGLWDSEKKLALNLIKEKTVPTSKVFSKWSSKLKEHFVSLCIDHELAYQHLLGSDDDVLSEEDGTARFMAN